jgi:hypothetical protein
VNGSSEDGRNAMTAQVGIWVVTDDFDLRPVIDTEETAFVPESRIPVERESLREHIILGYN